VNRLSRKGVGEKSYHFPKDQPPFQKGDNIVSATGNRWIKRFQFESSYAFKVLSDFKPKSIEDMALVTAMIRPSGGSYRDDLVKRVKNKNPSKIIDDLLKDNYGYLVYQEDVINFLQQICGMSGSEADNVRRAIGKFLPHFIEI
jgi:DNA polymerase III alpha subunit